MSVVKDRHQIILMELESLWNSQYILRNWTIWTRGDVINLYRTYRWKKLLFQNSAKWENNDWRCTMMQIWQFWSFVYKTREINVADLGQFGVVHTKKYIKNICYTFKGNINWSFDSSICIITVVYAKHTKYWVSKIFTFYNYLCITFRFQHHLHHRFSCNSCHFLSNGNVLKVQTWYAESLIILEDYVQIGHIKEQIQGYDRPQLHIKTRPLIDHSCSA